MKKYIPLLLLTMTFASCNRSSYHDKKYQTIMDQRHEETKAQMKLNKAQRDIK